MVVRGSSSGGTPGSRRCRRRRATAHSAPYRVSRRARTRAFRARSCERERGRAEHPSTAVRSDDPPASVEAWLRNSYDRLCGRPRGLHLCLWWCGWAPLGSLVTRAAALPGPRDVMLAPGECTVKYRTVLRSKPHDAGTHSRARHMIPHCTATRTVSRRVTPRAIAYDPDGAVLRSFPVLLR